MQKNGLFIALTCSFSLSGKPYNDHKRKRRRTYEKKLIFLDLDGTLWHGDHQIPQSTLDAIETARRNGHKVFSNTGRSQAEVPKKLS